MIKTVHKKCFNQIKVLFTTVLVILSTYLPTYTYSHEIYSYPIRWYTKITEDGKTKLYLKANKDYLDQPFLETYTSSLSNWNNAWSASANYNIHSVSHIKCIDTTYSNANLFFCSASKEWWQQLFNYSYEQYEFLALTENYNIYGTKVDSSTVSSVDRNIGKSIIYLSPYVTSTVYNFIQRRGILMHEMGHAIGLGHPNGTDSRNPYSAQTYGSIMDNYFNEDYPSIHDVYDIEIMYNFNCRY